MLGRQAKIHRPHERPEEVEVRSEATLFRSNGRSWDLYWRYIDPASDQWHRAPIPVGSGLTNDEKQTAAFLEKVFREIVRHEFPRTAYALRDSKGMGFDN